MSQVDIKIVLYAPDNPDRAKRVLEKTASSSLIINSVKSKVNVAWEII
jgi:hypothetical protein